MARPKLPKEQVLNPFVIRGTDADRIAWEMAAKDQPVSVWARKVLNRAAKRKAG